MADAGPYDVIVVGAGNAALCAALSAQEQGAKVLVLEKANEEERGGNSTFTAGGFRFVHHGADDLRERRAGRSVRCRGEADVHPAVHGGDLHGRPDEGDREPVRTGAGRPAGEPLARDRGVDAREGRALDSDVQAPVVSGERHPALLRRHGGGGGRRRLGPGRFPVQVGRTQRHPGALQHRPAQADPEPQGRGHRRHRVRPRRLRGHQREVGGARLRRLRGRSRDARALLRPRLGDGARARHAAQHRRRHQGGAGDRRRGVRRLVDLSCGAVGPQRAAVRRPRGARQLPEALLSDRHHRQRRTASASSTRARISATTPMPSTAAR